MIPYFVLASAVTLLSSFSASIGRQVVARDELNRRRTREIVRPPESRWTPFDLAALALLILFAGSRAGVGTDYIIYAAVYQKADPTAWGAELLASPMEVGFTYLVLALKTFSSNSQALFWACAVITILPVYLTIKKKCANPALALLLYVLLAYYVGPFNVVRQGIAISLMLWASTYLPSAKGKYLGLAIAAATFHSSVVLVVIIQLLLLKKRSRLKSSVAFLISSPFLAIGLSRFPAVGDWLAVLNPRYEQYLESSKSGLGTYLQIIALLALLGYAHLQARLHASSHADVRVDEQAPTLDERETLTAYVLIGVGFLIIGTQALVVSRMSAYFTIFLVLLLPAQLRRSRSMGLHSTVTVLASCVFFYLYLQNYANLLPYKSILFG